MPAKRRLVLICTSLFEIHEAGAPLPVHRIREVTGGSISYLEYIFTDLAHLGIVKSKRGPGGGYTLNQPLDQITIADIKDVADQAKPRDEKLSRKSIRVQDTVDSLVGEISLNDIYKRMKDQREQ